jgi:type IV secretion system protein VirB10
MGSYLCCKTIRLFELGTVEDAMRVAKPLIVMTAAIVFVAGQGRSAITQTPAANPERTSPEATPQATVGGSIASPSDVPAGSPRKTFTVPAGTKVLLQLRSSVNTKSARPGDGVYLSSTFPVVVGNRVLIPAGVFVQGVVDRVARAGHVKGKAQLDMHFTSMIFPNGSVVEIPGVVSGLPGASRQDVKNGEGTIEQDKNKTRNAGKTAEIAVPTGGTIGSVAGLGSGHPIAGGFGGVGAGLAAVGLVSLFTRGADVNIEAGSQVEMVFQRPLILEEVNLSEGVAPGAAPAMVPSPDQPKRLGKPGKPVVLCPPGGLGCS